MPIWMKVLIAAAMFIAGGLSMHVVDNISYSKLAAKHATFVAEVKVTGEQAKKEAAARAALEKKQKENSDADHKRAVAGLTAQLERMRNERNSGSGGLRAPETPPGSPDGTCLDPAQLAGALRRLDEGVLGLLGEGAKAQAELDSVKRWAQTK